MRERGVFSREERVSVLCVSLGRVFLDFFFRIDVSRGVGRRGIYSTVESF